LFAADLGSEMQLDATVEEQELLADTLKRDTTRLRRREAIAEGLVAIGFLASVAALLAIRSPHSFPLGTAAICVLVLAVSTRVRFYVASGFTVPTQLAYVPLVFIVPVALGPVAVLLALVLATAPDVLLGRKRPSRLLLCIGNSWFAIGPAVVFAAFAVEPAHASVGVLGLALVAQFLGDFASSSARDVVGSGSQLRAQLREGWVYAIDAGLSPVALAVAYQVGARPMVACGLLPLLGVFAFFARERRGRLESLVELKDAYQGTALVLGEVVEADDGYTGEHSRGVVRLALAVGERLGLGAAKLRNLEFGSLLHDVGKVAIPKEIINKPGKLDPSEWHIIRTHTVEGQRMLERVGGFMREVGLIVRSHHERWDGRGYPDGLAGKAIPLESRIIACCDAWNAMRTDRPYRAALSHAAAVSEVLASSGKQFDPSMVVALLAVVGEGEPVSTYVGSSDDLLPAPLPLVVEPSELG
jgi:putative nucleotidyltransferase with HDIG domain